MSVKTFTVVGKLHIFPMASPWKYIPIPRDKVPNVKPGGWGSIPLMVTVGKTTWRTSMFPMKKDHYFIPIKSAVVKKEELMVGDEVKVIYELA
jgi:hypothetical protein